MENLLSSNFLTMLSFAGLASAVGAILLGVRDLFGRRDPKAELQRELKRLPSFDAGDASTLTGRLDLWLERTLYWSGLGMTTLEAMLLLILAASAAGGSVFVTTENEMFAGIAGIAAVMGIVAFLEFRKRSRLKLFETQFPSALDLLARAVRAGESIDQALTLAGETSPDPAGAEFRRCARQLDLGLSLSACMKALSRRADLMDVKIFATTLSVHREAGGNLPHTLERLSEVIRERMSYHRQLRSTTAAGRFSATLILLAGPLLFAYMFLFQPQYGAQLSSDSMGRMMLVTAVVCELIGLLWVMRLIKAEY